LPADAAELMTRELPGVTFVEAHLTAMTASRR
jgi:hypothetical protein